jgi:hypothetical protein
MNPDRPRMPGWLPVLTGLLCALLILGGCLCGSFWWLDWFIGRQ